MFVYVSVWVHVRCGLCVESPRAWKGPVLYLVGSKDQTQVIGPVGLCCPYELHLIIHLINHLVTPSQSPQGSVLFAAREAVG